MIDITFKYYNFFLNFMHNGHVYVFKAKEEGLNPDYKNTENLIMMSGIIDEKPLFLISEYENCTKAYMLISDFVEKTYDIDKGAENYNELNFLFEKLFDARYIGDGNNSNPRTLTFDGNLSLEEQIDLFNNITSCISRKIEYTKSHDKRLKQFAEDSRRWSV